MIISINSVGEKSWLIIILMEKYNHFIKVHLVNEINLKFSLGIFVDSGGKRTIHLGALIGNRWKDKE
jgi:hypothetical protein